MTLKGVVRRHWLTMLVALIFFFWLGFFVTEYFYNLNYSTYSVEIRTNTIMASDVDRDFFYDALRKYDSEGNVIGYSYSSVNPNSFFENNDIIVTQNDKIVIITVKSKYFISVDGQTVSADSKTRFDNVMNKVVKFHDSEAFVSSGVTNKYISGLLVGGCAVLLGFIVITVIYFVYYKRHSSDELVKYDNDNIYSTPFHKKYWKDAFDEVRNIKPFDMCLIALLFALQMVVKIFRIPSGFSNLGIGITFLIFATICMIYGPIWGLFIGFFSDILGFFLFPNPTGATFFIGYSVQAMLSGFVYGFFLYKTDIKFSKTLICRLVINVLLNGVFGAILWGYVANLNPAATFAYMVSVTLPKNIIYLFPQSFILYIFLLLVLPLFEKKNIVSKEVIGASIKKK